MSLLIFAWSHKSEYLGHSLAVCSAGAAGPDYMQDKPGHSSSALLGLGQLSPFRTRRDNPRMAGKPDPYVGIDFEEITEGTGLAVDEIKCLKVGLRDVIITASSLSS